MTSDNSWPDVFSNLKTKTDLSNTQSYWAMNQVMSGLANAAEIKELLIGLKEKGETATEITSFVDAMLEHSVKLDVSHNAVDTCGTGGDALGTVNISTAAAIVVAGTGIPVVKHGNRAASSKSGSADVLEVLGIATNMTAEQVLDSYLKCGITFCFAPTFHPAMKYAGPVRKELAIPTVFNILGPLANPAKPKAQVVGVANLKMAPIVAQVLANRKVSAIVVRGLEGLDEISVSGPTQIWDARNAEVKESLFNSLDIGIKQASLDELKGGDANFNAELILQALRNTGSEAIRDAICVNAAASVVAYENPTGDFKSSMELAVARTRGSLESGAALDVLNRWVEFSKNVRP